MVNNLAVTNIAVRIMKEINSDIRIYKDELDKPVRSIAVSATNQTKKQKQQQTLQILLRPHQINPGPYFLEKNNPILIVISALKYSSKQSTCGFLLNAMRLWQCRELDNVVRCAFYLQWCFSVSPPWFLNFQKTPTLCFSICTLGEWQQPLT